MGGADGLAYIGEIDGTTVAIVVAMEGKYAGKVHEAIKPGSQQLGTMLSR